MAQGITGFYDVAKQREFARDFQFRVVNLGPLAEQDLMYLKSAVLPGKEISNQQVSYMGLQFNVPGSVKYPGSPSWEVKLWSDEANNVRSKMAAWMTEIFDVQTSTGKYGVPVEEATIDLLDKGMKTIRRYNLIGVYIQKLADVPYDITGNGKPVEFTSTIAYQYWTEI